MEDFQYLVDRKWKPAKDKQQFHQLKSVLWDWFKWKRAYSAIEIYCTSGREEKFAKNDHRKIINITLKAVFFIIHLGRSTALTGKKNPGRTTRKKNKRDAPTTFFLYHPFREIRFSCWEILAATEKLFFLSKVTIGTRYAGLPSIEKEKEPTGQSVDLHGTWKRKSSLYFIQRQQIIGVGSCGCD